MLWLILLPVAASAATGDLATDVEREIRTAYLDNRYEYVLTIPQTDATPADGYDYLQVTALRNVTPRGNFPVKVTFFKDGLAVRSANLAVRVNLYRQVLVATRRLKRGEPLDSTMFTLARREVSDLRSEPVTSFERLTDMCVSRTIKNGDILLAPLLTKYDLIKRGDLVQIEYDRLAVKLTASGEAKEAGGRGDLIKVKNLSSNKTIIAEVKDDQTVEVLK